MALSQPRDMAERTQLWGHQPRRRSREGSQVTAFISALTFIFLKWRSLSHTEQRGQRLSSTQDSLVLLDCLGVGGSPVLSLGL